MGKGKDRVKGEGQGKGKVWKGMEEKGIEGREMGSNILAL